MQQYENGHLGGCVKGGDPATFYPKMWDFFINLLQIKSFLDIGCGEGHSLKYFKEKGLEVLGIEGLQEAINNSEMKNFIILHDYTKRFYVELCQKFDAVWCCEFVEHIEEQYVNNFINTIIDSDAEYVFLTHAVPGQGGYHHVNLQHPSYWIVKMNEANYELDPVLTRMARSIAYMENINPIYNHFYNHGLIFKKKKDIKIKKNAIFTWMSGKEFCKNDGIKVFVNSLNKTDYDGDKIVFTHDMDIDIREFLIKNDFKIVDVNPNECTWVVRDRFLFWYRYLCYNKYSYVGLFDSKDVVFQENPMKSTTLRLALVSECKKHKDCDWNMQDQSRLQKDIPLPLWKDKYQEEDVICAGTILGDRIDILSLCAAIWAGTATSCKATDQAVLNFLARTLFERNASILTSYLTTNDRDNNENDVKIIDGEFYSSKHNFKYDFIHQYDRVEEYKKIVFERYL